MQTAWARDGSQKYLLIPYQVSSIVFDKGPQKQTAEIISEWTDRHLLKFIYNNFDHQNQISSAFNVLFFLVTLGSGKLWWANFLFFLTFLLIQYTCIKWVLVCERGMLLIVTNPQRINTWLSSPQVYRDLQCLSAHSFGFLAWNALVHPHCCHLNFWQRQLLPSSWPGPSKGVMSLCSNSEFISRFLHWRIENCMVRSLEVYYSPTLPAVYKVLWSVSAGRSLI